MNLNRSSHDPIPQIAINRIRPHRIAGEHTSIGKPASPAFECPMLEPLGTASNVNGDHSRLAFWTAKTLDR
jgi:hypothetical protein